MLKDYDFRVTQLRQLRAAALQISSFKPLGKTATDIAAMIPPVPDPLRQAFNAAEMGLAGARGGRDDALKPVHDVCVDFREQARGMYRSSGSVQRQLDAILVQDKTPQETFTRAGQTQACWASLPLVGTPPAAFKVGHDNVEFTKTDFDTLVALATPLQADVDTKRFDWEKQQGLVNAKIKEWKEFIKSALEYGRSRYSEETTERGIIDAIVKERATVAPGKAVITSIVYENNGATILFAAPHATSFDVYMRLGGTGEFELVASDILETTYTHSDTHGDFEFKVVGRNSEGAGEESDVASISG